MQACRSSFAGSLVLVLLIAQAAATDWPRFRGPNGAGLAPALDFPARWGEQDYRWKVRLPGVGHSSPVVWGERVFVTCADEKAGTRSALCLDAATGRQLWRRHFPLTQPPRPPDNGAASATPAADERHLYVAFADARQYLVVALTHAGEEVWRADLGPFRGGHGFGASPVVCEGVVAVA